MDRQFNNSKIHLDAGGIILAHVQAERTHIQPCLQTIVSGCNELAGKISSVFEVS